jgi:hypothetical protein
MSDAPRKALATAVALRYGNERCGGVEMMHACEECALVRFLAV